MTLYDVLMTSLTEILTEGWGHGDPEFHHEYYKVKLQIPHCTKTSLLDQAHSRGIHAYSHMGTTIIYGLNTPKRAVLMRNPLFTFLQEAVLPDG